MLPSRFKLNTAVMSHLLKTFTVFSFVVGLSGCNENLKDCDGFWDKTFGRDSCTVTPSIPAPKPAPVCSATEFLDAPNNVCKTKDAQNITGLNLPSLSVGSKATLAATTNSGLAVSYVSQSTSVCTIAGVEVTAIAAGTCSIAANQSGDATHLAARQVLVNQLVTPVCTATEFLDVVNNVCKAKSSQTITGLTLPALSVGNKATLAASSNSGLAVSYASQTAAICTVNAKEVTAIAKGTCTIAANQAGDATHLAAIPVLVNQLVTPVCTATEFLDVTSNACKAKATQTITGLSLPALSVGDKATLAASSNSGLAVSYASQTPTTCTLNTKEVTAIAAGTCTIVANQSGDATHLAATQVLVNQLVTPVCTATEFLDVANNVCKAKSSQVITGLNLPTLLVGSKVALSAIADSGLTVSYASQTTGVCTIAGVEVTAIAAGTCSISANQSGDATHLAAEPVLASQLVTPLCLQPQLLDTLTNTCVNPPNMTINAPVSATVGEQIMLTLQNAWSTVVQVVWSFGQGIADIVANVGDTISQTFTKVGNYTVTATGKDANGNVVTTATQAIAVNCPTGQILDGSGVCMLPAKFKGQLIDSNVEGVEWKTATRSGVTDVNGYFDYDTVGEVVQFKIGNTILGAASANEFIHVFDLQSSSGFSGGLQGHRVAQLLQSLDSDGDDSNGIQISDVTSSLLKNAPAIPFTGEQLAFEGSVQAVSPNNILVPLITAVAHAQANLPAPLGCRIAPQQWIDRGNTGLGNVDTANFGCLQRAAATAFFGDVYARMEADELDLLESPWVANNIALSKQEAEDLAKKNWVNNVFQGTAKAIHKFYDIDLDKDSKIKIISKAVGVSSTFVKGFSSDTGTGDDELSLKILHLALSLNACHAKWGDESDCLKALGGSTELSDLISKKYPNLLSEDIQNKRDEFVKKAVPLLRVLIDGLYAESPSDALNVAGSLAEVMLKSLSDAYTREATNDLSAKNTILDATAAGIKGGVSCVAAAISTTGKVEDMTTCLSNISQIITDQAQGIFSSYFGESTNADLRLQAYHHWMARLILSEKYRYGSWDAVLQHYGILNEYDGGFFSTSPFVQLYGAVERAATPQNAYSLIDWHAVFSWNERKYDYGKVFDEVVLYEHLTDSTANSLLQGRSNNCATIALGDVHSPEALLQSDGSYTLGLGKPSNFLASFEPSNVVRYEFSWGDGTTHGVYDAAAASHTHTFVGNTQVEIIPWVKGSTGQWTSCEGQRKSAYFTVKVNDELKLTASKNNVNINDIVHFSLEGLSTTVAGYVSKVKWVVADETGEISSTTYNMDPSGVVSWDKQFFYFSPNDLGDKTVSVTLFDGVQALTPSIKTTIHVGANTSITPSTLTPTINQPMTFTLSGAIDSFIGYIKEVIWTFGTDVVHSILNFTSAVQNIFTSLGEQTVTAVIYGTNDQTIGNVTPVTVVVGCPIGKIVQDGVCISEITTNPGSSGDPVISPLTATAGQKQIFTVTWGNDLPAGMYFHINDCENTVAVAGGDSHTRQFECTFTSAVGVKNAIIKSASNVTYGFYFTVSVNSTALPSGLLNDTGITQCSNESTLFADCSAASMGGWFGLNQDGEVGRDFLAANGQLTKVGAGDAGFDFTKINATGQSLPASATDWSCVKDNHTGLMWEVKTDDGGLRDKDNTYRWYNTDTNTNGGAVGFDDGGNNTQAFAQAVNTQTLCGHNNWRLPSKKELLSIVNYSKSYSAIDGAYFPNTQSGEYWSSSPDAHDSYRAWGVFFNRGQDSGDHKSNTLFVRLVRASQ